MNKSNLRPTNFVIVVDFSESNNYLEDQYLLGWNNNYDWFDCESIGDDLIESDGSVKQNEWGLIDIDRWTSVYVGETQSDVQDHSDSGNREGYNCTVCRLEKDSEGEWIVVPV